MAHAAFKGQKKISLSVPPGMGQLIKNYTAAAGPVTHKLGHKKASSQAFSKDQIVRYNSNQHSVSNSSQPVLARVMA